VFTVSRCSEDCLEGALLMRYTRVEDPNARNIGCDPPGMPTASYIAR
jgi:hypothetical protein